jgi:hypothetical protein
MFVHQICVMACALYLFWPLEICIKDTVVFDCSQHKRTKYLNHTGFHDETVEHVYTVNRPGVCDSEYDFPDQVMYRHVAAKLELVQWSSSTVTISY